MEIPHSLREEHEELLSLLHRAVEEKGAVGTAAQKVANELLPHFEKEEEIALPPLGALSLSGEKRITEPERIVALTERLREELPEMLEEHVRIAVALEKLRAEAEREGADEHVRFCRMLLHHARMEEEITYPAALLIGSYIRQNLARRA